MNLRQIADLAVARFGIPVPMAKLATIQAVAKALDCEDTAMVFAEALAKWASTRKLESQCLEAICPLLVAAPRPEVTALVRNAICRPSIASDSLLSLATGSPTLVAGWTGCHSGPAAQHSMLDEEQGELCAGVFIPLIFVHELQRLEKRANRPLMRQWAFEYKELNSRFDSIGDGHLDYFLGGDREAAGQFVAHRSHVARSAFLRTIAFAVDGWGMPVEAASRFAELAFPIEPIFLRLQPQNAPGWAQTLQHSATKAEGAPEFAKSLIESLELELNGRLMHCSLAVADEPRCHVDFEVFAIAEARSDLDAAEVIRFYEHLRGKMSPDRDGFRAFVSPDLDADSAGIIGFAPLLLPLVGSLVGYLQSDFVGRVPYVPVSSKGLPSLELAPTKEGAMFRSNGRNVGRWNWWRWNWKPSYTKHQLSPTACCASLNHDAARQLIAPFGGVFEHVWRATTWTRETDYVKWTKSERIGRIRN